MTNPFRAGLLATSVLAKELRVMSRHRRQYALRSVYVTVVILFVAALWGQWTRSYYYKSSQTEQLHRIGQGVTLVVLGVQYFSVILVVLVQLAGSINAEIRSRTIGPLLSTPVSPGQVVLGKLLAGLWPGMLMIALSLPLLTLVRIFGGVEIQPVLGVLAITLAGAVFAGSLAMLMSSLTRHAWATLLLTLAALAFWELAVPATLIVLADFGKVEWFNGPGHAFPAWSVMAMLDHIQSPSWTSFSVHWPVVCLFALGFSAPLLLICRRRVAALSLGPAPRATRTHAEASGSTEPDSRPLAGIRRVVGFPVVWRELRQGMFRTRRAKVIAALLALLVLAVPYGLAAWEEELADSDFHGLMAVGLLLAPALAAAVVASTTLTTEREARTMEVLLASGVSAFQIVLGKALGVIRRTGPVWALLLAHGIVFSILLLPPVVLAFDVPILLGVLACATGVGLWASSRCRKTTAAAVLTIAILAAMWLGVVGILPVYLEVSSRTGYGGDPFAEMLVEHNPFLQAGIVHAWGAWRVYPYGPYSRPAWRGPANVDWPGGHRTPAETLFLLIRSALVWSVVGAGFGALAWARVHRRKVL